MSLDTYAHCDIHVSKPLSSMTISGGAYAQCAVCCDEPVTILDFHGVLGAYAGFAGAPSLTCRRVALTCGAYANARDVVANTGCITVGAYAQLSYKSVPVAGLPDIVVHEGAFSRIRRM